MARRRQRLAIPSSFAEPKPRGDFHEPGAAAGHPRDDSRRHRRAGAIRCSSPLVPVPERARGLLLRMFADPYVLEQTERSELLGQLRESVGAHPEVPELRVLLGMALCVNLEVQQAMEELREGVRL